MPGLADVSLLGRGRSRDVLLGRQLHLERWVVATVDRVSLDDPAAVERFRAECHTLGRLDHHPHVITLHDAGVLADGRPYLVSERCTGSVADLLRSHGALSIDRAVEIGLAAARALQFALTRGLSHGDVTPRAVLFRASGTPVLADFGLPVLRERRCAPGTGRATDHTAPETVRTGRVDEASDVFGLASTIATMLDGNPPFPSDAAGAGPRLTRIAGGPPPPPPEVPAWLAGLLTRMLVADPARRPSVDEVVTTLATRAPVTARGPLVTPVPRPSSSPVPRPRPARVGTSGRVRAAALCLLAAGVVVGGAGGVWLAVAGPDPAAAESSVSAAVPATSAPPATTSSSPGR